MGVTHFLMLSKTESAPYLRVARTPQGPTLTFKIQEYSLAVDIAHSQLHPRCPKDLFKNPPLVNIFSNPKILNTRTSSLCSRCSCVIFAINFLGWDFADCAFWLWDRGAAFEANNHYVSEYFPSHWYQYGECRTYRIYQMLVLALNNVNGSQCYGFCR